MDTSQTPPDGTANFTWLDHIRLMWNIPSGKRPRDRADTDGLCSDIYERSSRCATTSVRSRRHWPY